MENAIATARYTIPVEINFKNPELNEATAKLANILSGVGMTLSTADIEVCKVLGEISATQCYKDDGFDSVAAYADSVFGLGKSNAYAKARVGSNFYNNPDMEDVLSALPLSISRAPSKVIELLDCTAEDIMQGIESGEINDQSTQKDLRAWGDSHAVPTSKRGAKRDRVASDKPKTLPNIEVFGRYGNQTVSFTASDIPDNAEDVAFSVARALSVTPDDTAIIKNLPTLVDDNGERSIKRAVYVDENGNAVFAQWRRIKDAKPRKTLTPEEIRKKMAELSAMLEAQESEDEE